LCFFQIQLTQLQTLTHRDQLAANATPTTPTPTQTCPSANPRRYRRYFIFLYIPSSQKRGAGWGGGAQRARGNEINTARRKNRFRTCRLAVF
jgi:hypothetical protein